MNRVSDVTAFGRAANAMLREYVRARVCARARAPPPCAQQASVGSTATRAPHSACRLSEVYEPRTADVLEVQDAMLTTLRQLNGPDVWTSAAEEAWKQFFAAVAEQLPEQAPPRVAAGVRVDASATTQNASDLAPAAAAAHASASERAEPRQPAGAADDALTAKQRRGDGEPVPSAMPWLQLPATLGITLALGIAIGVTIARRAAPSASR
ncbi:hypothetical protein EON67_06405 [archaeon]|nr:MAG: hypothetical protein EON67_06405 [archaeon]